VLVTALITASSYGLKVTERSEGVKPENPVELIRIVVPTAALEMAPPLVLENAEAVTVSVLTTIPLFPLTEIV
jgi:hypothetical protein